MREVHAFCRGGGRESGYYGVRGVDIIVLEGRYQGKILGGEKLEGVLVLEAKYRLLGAICLRM